MHKITKLPSQQAVKTIAFTVGAGYALHMYVTGIAWHRFGWHGLTTPLLWIAPALLGWMIGMVIYAHCEDARLKQRTPTV